jgi:VanZ family protein
MTILIMLVVFAALGPAKLQFRTGLGWQMDHILGYFAFTSMVCVLWPRPRMAGAGITAFAVLLEGLQAVTPDWVPDVQAAIYSASGVLAAALSADLLIRAARWINGRLLPQDFGVRWPS